MNEMTLLFRIAVFMVCLTVVGISFLELSHLIRYGHFISFGMHADVLIRKADYGIPGITKVYEGELTNYGIAPVKVTACDFIDDTLSHGTQVGCTIQKWDIPASRWINIFKNDDSAFCHPYPLGMVETHIITKRLWFGQSISAGEEATAARDVFAIGDKARFVVFAGNGLAFPTAAFSIDEHHVGPDVPYSIRH
jgi:hypothetical protein